MTLPLFKVLSRCVPSIRHEDGTTDQGIDRKEVVVREQKRDVLPLRANSGCFKNHVSALSHLSRSLNLGEHCQHKAQRVRVRFVLVNNGRRIQQARMVASCSERDRANQVFR